MVTVRLFARFRELAGKDTLSISISGPLPLKAFVQTLSGTLPDIVALIQDKHAMVAVNQEAASEDSIIRDGDEVAFMPPFAGGSSGIKKSVHELASQSWTRIQTADFSIDHEISRIRNVSGRTGGIALFLGSVRDVSKGQAVEALIYEHYAGMADQKLKEIRSRAKTQYDIIEVAMIHRTGRIEVGKNAVLVVVGAEHRGEALRACRWCIDEIKSTLPIWKKELTAEGEIWVEGCL